MVEWSVILSKQAVKDIEKLKRVGLAQSAKELFVLLAADPFTTQPKLEKLVGKLQCFYSRRINIQHRLVYSIDKESRVIHVLSLWSHYE